MFTNFTEISLPTLSDPTPSMHYFLLNAVVVKFLPCHLRHIFRLSLPWRRNLDLVLKITRVQFPATHFLWTLAFRFSSKDFTIVSDGIKRGTPYSSCNSFCTEFQFDLLFRTMIMSSVLVVFTSLVIAQSSGNLP